MTGEPHDSIVRSLCESVGGSRDVMLWEGLPHQHLERAVLENERRTKPVRELGGFLFYQEPLSAKPEDALVLREMFSEEKTFEPFSGEKLCGGFHPDFALEWDCGGARCYSMVCLGCVEVVSIAQNVVLRSDLAKEAFLRTYRVLRPYRLNRPESARDRTIETAVRFQEALRDRGVTHPGDVSPELLQELIESLSPRDDES